MREVQYRKDGRQWLPLGAFARGVFETQWRPPASGLYRFRHRLVDRNGDPLSQWGYSDRLEVAVRPPPPFYGAVPPDGCPPAERGVLGQLWIAPDGRVWRRGPDVWTTDELDNGILARFDDQPFWHQRGGTLFVLAYTAAFADERTLPASMGSLKLGFVEYRPATHRWLLDFFSATPYSGERTGSNLPDSVAEHLAVAVRADDDGNSAWSQVQDTDEADPYLWIDDAGDAVFAGRTTSFTGQVLFVDLSKRCPDDPLNPWVPEPPLGVVGLDGRGIEWISSLAATDDAIPAGEIPPNTLPYDAARNDDGDDVGVRIVGGAVSAASSGGRLWFDEDQQTSKTSPFAVSMFREVPGQPARGAVPDATWGAWQGPVFRRLWAADGGDGATYLEAKIFKKVTRQASGNTPSTPADTTIAFSATGFTWSAPDGWSKTIPNFDVHTEFLFCASSLFDSTATSAEWGDPALCDDLPDLNVIYSDRSDTQPANPGGSDRQTVSRDPPDGWHDRVQDVPAGDGPIWVSVGLRQADQNQFTWSDAAKFEGQDGDAGDDGKTYLEAKIFKKVTRQASGNTPSTPADTTIAFSATGFTWSAPDGWSKTIPNFDVHTEFLFCASSLFDSTATSAEWGDPALCDDLPDLNVIYSDRSDTQPANPGGSDRQTVSRDPPDGWHDRVQDVPAGDGPIWVSVGLRQAEQTQFTWSDAAKFEGQDATRVSLASIVRFWSNIGNIASQSVTWSQGNTRIARLNVFVDGRLSGGVRQCQMRLSGMSGVTVKVDGRVRAGNTYSTSWNAVPCEHTIEIAGAVCEVVIAAPETTTVADRPGLLFMRTGGTEFTPRSADVTWRNGPEHRTVRFTPRFSSNRLQVTAATVSGTLGAVPGTINFDDDAYLSGRSRSEDASVDDVPVTIYIVDAGL